MICNSLLFLPSENLQSKYLINSENSGNKRRYASKKMSNQQKAIICGFAESYGNAEKFTSLILGMYDNNTLKYVGNVSSGFDHKTIEYLYQKLKNAITLESPFQEKTKSNHVTWIKPKIICQVRFLEWTYDGIMRHPIFLKLRFSKKVRNIVRTLPKK